MPAPGVTCNGCGVCCATEPCPLGMVLSWRRTGACRALAWNEAGRHYRCQVVAAPGALWPRLPKRWAPAVSWLARRWISAASGCDAHLQVDKSPASTPDAP
jgi:hypothetical protein